MLSYAEEQKAVTDAIAQYPAEFGLRAFAGDTFTILAGHSYYSDGEVFLYVGRKTDDGWRAFCKGTMAELDKSIVR